MDAWDKARIFGVVKCDKNVVKLYYSLINYETITLANDVCVRNAMWGGEGVVIYLTNGKVRLYKSKSSYIDF